MHVRSETNEIEDSPEIEENTQLGPWMKKRYMPVIFNYEFCSKYFMLYLFVISVSVVFVPGIFVAKLVCIVSYMTPTCRFESKVHVIPFTPNISDKGIVKRNSRLRVYLPNIFYFPKT